MTREDAARAIEQVITQDQNYAAAAEGLRFLLGEIRDLELERNKCELDAAHWKERYEDAVKMIEQVSMNDGRER